MIYKNWGELNFPTDNFHLYHLRPIEDCLGKGERLVTLSVKGRREGETNSGTPTQGTLPYVLLHCLLCFLGNSSTGERTRQKEKTSLTPSVYNF